MDSASLYDARSEALTSTCAPRQSTEISIEELPGSGEPAAALADVALAEPTLPPLPRLIRLEMERHRAVLERSPESHCPRLPRQTTVAATAVTQSWDEAG